MLLVARLFVPATVLAYATEVLCPSGSTPGVIEANFIEVVELGTKDTPKSTAGGLGLLFGGIYSVAEADLTEPLTPLLAKEKTLYKTLEVMLYGTVVV